MDPVPLADESLGTLFTPGVTSAIMVAIRQFDCIAHSFAPAVGAGQHPDRELAMATADRTT